MEKGEWVESKRKGIGRVLGNNNGRVSDLSVTEPVAGPPTDCLIICFNMH